MIYLDFNASTPADQRVVEAMVPYFTELHANASSTDHAAGARARAAVEAARAEVARLIGTKPEEVVFTSGATESNNIAILGQLRRRDAGEVLVSAIEHPAVLEPAMSAADVRLIPVDRQGFVDVGAFRSMISSDTRLVCVMAANNETGAVQDLEEIASICAAADVPLHVDAAQAVGRIPVAVHAGISTMAISGHKMYGPQGIGALYVRRTRPRARLAPVIFGGGHEHNIRPGTFNVPGIVGLGEAARLVRLERQADANREQELKEAFLSRLREASPVPVEETCASGDRLPQTLSIRFVGVRSAAVLRLVSRDLAISTGAACSTTSVEPSHVLLAQGLSRGTIAETLRISFGRQTSEQDLDSAASLLLSAVEEVATLGHSLEAAGA